MKIYLGFRISGSSYEAVTKYVSNVQEELDSCGYTVMHPMTGKESLRTETQFKAHGYAGIPQATNHAIFERDIWMVRQCDVFYLNLMDADERVSIGGVMELAVAAALGEHTVVSMGAENIHQHAFVLEAADVIYETHEEAMKYLERLML